MAAAPSTSQGLCATLMLICGGRCVCPGLMKRKSNATSSPDSRHAHALIMHCSRRFSGMLSVMLSQRSPSRQCSQRGRRKALRAPHCRVAVMRETCRNASMREHGQQAALLIPCNTGKRRHGRSLSVVCVVGCPSVHGKQAHRVQVESRRVAYPLFLHRPRTRARTRGCHGKQRHATAAPSLPCVLARADTS